MSDFPLAERERKKKSAHHTRKSSPSTVVCIPFMSVTLKLQWITRAVHRLFSGLFWPRSVRMTPISTRGAAAASDETRCSCRPCGRIWRYIKSGHSVGGGAPFIPVKAVQCRFKDYKLPTSLLWIYRDLLCCAARRACALETSTCWAGYLQFLRPANSNGVANS